MTWLQVVILAIVEGLTEFLPISSTGHLILTSFWLQIPHSDFTKAFDVIIQIGPILMVLFFYKDRFRWNFLFYRNLFFAFLPAAVIGFILKNKIDLWLESPLIVAWSLILGGLVLLGVDRFTKAGSNLKTEDLGIKNSILVGFFQCLALIPGVSRSGATLLGALSAKMSRHEAAEFSFFLAVPTIGAATGYKIAKLILSDTRIATDQILQILVGLIIASLVAAFAIRGFIHYLQKKGFAIFGWYRIILGALLLIYLQKMGL